MTTTVFPVALLWLMSLLSRSKTFARNTGIQGKEFVFAIPPNYMQDPNHVGIILDAANNAQTFVNVSVPLQSLHFPVTLHPNSGPYEMELPSSLHGSTISGRTNRTLVITSTEDITVVAYNYAHRTIDTFVALPLKSLGKEYFVMSYVSPTFSGVILISASEDPCSIEVFPTSSLEFKNHMYSRNDVISLELGMYESIQLITQDTTITGTRIIANVSISVVVGVPCINIPVAVSYCDHASEHLSPFNRWGYTYVLSPFFNRLSGYAFQVVAGRNNTTVILSRNDSITLDMGEYYSGNVRSQSMVYMVADKPISIMQYVKSHETDYRPGDPAMHRVPSVEQYVNNAVIPVDEFPAATAQTKIQVFLALTTLCNVSGEVMMHHNYSSQEMDISWLSNYTIITPTGLQICTKWTRVSQGTLIVDLYDESEKQRAFNAFVYGASIPMAFVYNPASALRQMTCTAFNAVSNSTAEGPCQTICNSVKIGNSTFPRGELGTWVDSLEKCPGHTLLGEQPLGRAQCVGDTVSEPSWDPSFLPCADSNDISDILEAIIQDGITSETANDAAILVVNITTNYEDISARDIAQIGNITRAIVDLQLTDPEITSSITSIVNNIAQTNPDELLAAEEEDGSVSELVGTFEEQLNNVFVPRGETFSASESNVAVLINNTMREDIASGVTLTVSGDDETDLRSSNIVLRSTNETDFDDTNVQTRVILPSEISNDLNDSNARIVSNIYNTDALFVSPSLQEAKKNNDRFNRSVNTMVVAVGVGGQTIRNFTNRISFTFRIVMPGYDNPSCVFWDFDVSDWSTSGCDLVPSTDNPTGEFVTCTCDHLTNFAVIMDIHKDRMISPVLNTLSIVGCCLSIITLIITLVTYLANKSLRARQSQKIFICLCTTLLGLYVSFLIMTGVDKYPDERDINPIPCAIIAAFVHFFVLSSLAWMGVEGYHTYLIVVRVFDTYIPKFMMKAGIVAWGGAALIVILTGGVARNNYSLADYCYLQKWPLVGSVLIPVAIILLGNVVIFILVIHRLVMTSNFQGRVKNDDERSLKESKQRVGNAICILLLLGLTWITGYLTLIGSSNQVVEALFIIFNSFQGLYIFLVYCVLSPVVRGRWRRVRLACMPVKTLRSKGTEDGSSSANLTSARFTSGNVARASTTVSSESNVAVISTSVMKGSIKNQDDDDVTSNVYEKVTSLSGTNLEHGGHGESKDSTHDYDEITPT